MTLKPWKVLESSYLRKNVRVDKCEIANGMILEPLVLEYGDWVTVLALTQDGQVPLVRQYRHGVQSVIWELPGGMLEPGETPIEGGLRELLEETGFTGERGLQVGQAFPNPGNHNNTNYSVLALDVQKVSEQHLDATEDIEVALIPIDEVIEMAR